MPKLQIQLDKQSAKILDDLKSRSLKAVFVNAAIKDYAKNCEADIFFDDTSGICAGTKMEKAPKESIFVPENNGKATLKEW